MFSLSQEDEQNKWIQIANGGHRNLGWGRVKILKSGEEIKLFEDSNSFGKGNDQTFKFTEQSCPTDVLQFMSANYFTISREPVHNAVNYKPAWITVLGRNGIFLNDELLLQNSKKMLMNCDVLRILNVELVTYYDDRDYGTSDLPEEISLNYHLDAFIGKGGQSSVRLIHRIKTGGKFAMKIIAKKQFEAEPLRIYEKRIQHMRDEVEAMKQLSHPNVVHFVESFESFLDCYIIMNYADQGDLLAYMKTFHGAYLPQQHGKRCLYQVTKGLQYIHSKGIAHRDIKVDNIFVKRDRYQIFPIFMIGDFGYCKKAENHLYTQVGTACYAPPEIIDSNGTEYTIKADIWTLGCLFFAVLSGSYPFHENFGKTVKEQIKKADFNFNNDRWDFVHNDCKRLISRMIQVRPDLRPSTDDIVVKFDWFNDRQMLEDLNFLYGPAPPLPMTSGQCLPMEGPPAKQQRLL